MTGSSTHTNQRRTEALTFRRIRRALWAGAALFGSTGLIPGCGEEPPATSVPAPRPVPVVASPRGPAGEVPLNSRRVHDEGDSGAPAVAGYSYGFPGVPGTGTHYHLLVPDAGEPRAALAGGATDRGLALRVYRTERVVDVALAVKAALSGTGAEILDPVTAGGCGDAADHAHPDSGLRSPPPVRVVRARIDPADLPRWEAAIAEIPGLRRILAAGLGGDGKWKGEVVLDVHLVP